MMNTSADDTSKATHAGRLAAASAALQRMLASQGALDRTAPMTRRAPPTIDHVGNQVPQSDVPAGTGPAAQPTPGPDWLRFVPAEVRGLVASHLPPGLPDFAGPVGGYTLPKGMLHQGFPPSADVAVPDGARFVSGSFANEAGTRPYKLYVPSGYDGRPVPLVVMLHGCTQSPDDFAAGTGMNAVAEEHTCLVLYPGQTKAANAQKCWNWFSAQDQRRGTGEPSLIAGMTQQVMRDYAIDPRRVYVAGLSAGGAAAAIMGEAYPELYAAIGVHSGLACGAARDLPSALAAMKRGSSGNVVRPRPGDARHKVVPTIVFHGDRDATVSPSNGDDVVAQAVRGTAPPTRVRTGQTAGGRAYSCTAHLDESGQPIVEQWVIHGAGHAWSGGSTAGSYTDPHGPDAAREMLRFFLEHPRTT